MRRRFYARWLASWGLASASLTWAQAQAPAPPIRPVPVRTYNVKLDLAPLLAHGYHVSVEKLWSPAHRQALVVTPQLYQGQVPAAISAQAGGRHYVRGYGLGLQHRIYLHERTTALAGFYLGYGLQYQHFRLQFQAPSWQAEADANGLTYYELRTRDQQETVDRYGASAVVGHQFFLPSLPIFLDIYLGLGLRKASSRATLPGNHHESGMSDYGADGYYLPAGLRVGVAW